MEKTGLCSICGKPARNTCSMCGRVVCDDHFDKKLGICTSCKKGRMMSS
ncbi:MAG: hypothetical protein QXR58_02100 [Candidatus Micrarchaeaceae archaeon]